MYFVFEAHVYQFSCCLTRFVHEYSGIRIVFELTHVLVSDCFGFGIPSRGSDDFGESLAPFYRARDNNKAERKVTSNNSVAILV